MIRRFHPLDDLGRACPAPQEVADYWTGHTVACQEHQSREASLQFLSFRNNQYLGYAEQMPVDRADDLVVLDYGCGPGNDLVGFREHSRVAKLIGADVSKTAIALSRRRMQHHGQVELILLQEAPPAIPLDDASVDLVHSSGVLHHTADPIAILREFHRILRPAGSAQIMVYNRESVWFHLYANYVWRKENGISFDVNRNEVFRRTTDGPECPIANCYTVAEFTQLGEAAGFRVEHVGNSIDVFELDCLQRYRGAALRDRLLDDESRRFLYGLTFDERGRPLHNGQVAGINGSFRLYPS